MYSDEPPTSPLTQLLRSTEPQSLMSPAWQQDEMRQRAASWQTMFSICVTVFENGHSLDCSSSSSSMLFTVSPSGGLQLDRYCIRVLLLNSAHLLSFFSVLSHPRLSLVLFAVSVRHGKFAAQLGWWPPTRIGKASFRVLCHFAVTSNTRPRIRSSNSYKCRLSHIAIGHYTIG